MVIPPNWMFHAYHSRNLRDIPAGHLHLHWVSCALLNFGKRCTSCYFSASSVRSFLHITHAIYVRFLSVSAVFIGATASFLIWETGVLPVVFLLPASELCSISHTQFTRHIRWGICVLFTLGNRCITCYATHAIYAACQRNLKVNIQRRYWSL